MLLTTFELGKRQVDNRGIGLCDIKPASLQNC